MMKLANRGGASQDGGFHGGGEICATRNDSAYLPEDSMQRPVTQYRTCSVKIWFISRLVINFQSFIGL